MRQAAAAPSFAKTTCNSIHLVKGSKVFAETLANPIRTASESSFALDRPREVSELAGTLAFAGVALIAPLAWLGHALLVHWKMF